MLGGYAAILEAGAGAERRFHALFGLRFDRGGKEARAELGMVVHEFCHGFVNPVTEEHREAVARLAPLFGPIEERMRGMNYGTWEICFNEHVVRVATGRVLRALGLAEYAEELLRRDRDAGFAYIDAFASVLDERRPVSQVVNTYRDDFPAFLAELRKRLPLGRSGVRS